MGKIIDLHEKEIATFIESLRPDDPDIRKQIDFGYDYANHTIELYSIRPAWNDPQVFRKEPFAKIRYIQSRRIWKLFWMRASLKWNAYEPFPDSPRLQDLLLTIKEDSYGCFFG
ncbi:MAG: DUF3024 domain-containing protein [Saprospiraceae bacterium]|nr:DUF3024 domain-containing protein [Saprospiraceae bacterium]